MHSLLPGGLVLRPAAPPDLDQIAALLTDRGEPEDAIDHRLVVTDPDAGWPTCAVVVDGDRVVSTATLLDEALVLGGVPIPTGQVELVATDRAYDLAHGNDVTVTGRSGTVAGAALAPFLGEPPADAQSYYARVADPAALVAHLRPVLSARLAAAGFAKDAAGLVSFFRSHIRFPVTDGQVGPVTAGGTCSRRYAPTS